MTNLVPEYLKGHQSAKFSIKIPDGIFMFLSNHKELNDFYSKQCISLQHPLVYSE